MRRRFEYTEIKDDPKVEIKKSDFFDWLKDSFDNYIKYYIVLTQHDEANLLEYGVYFH